MFLRESTISNLATFIAGYQICDQIKSITAGKPIDKFFGTDGFYSWYVRKYDIKESSHWYILFLEQMHYNEWEALNLFFEKLEEFSKEVN